MIFEDPIKTLRVEVPAGWAYNPFDSTLTDFVFVRWDQPAEMIAVHVRRASVPASQPDEKWIEKIRSEIGSAGSLTDMISNHGCAVAADFRSGRGVAQRVAFVRGPHVELVVEQRSNTAETKDQWSPLDRIVRTSSSGANTEIKDSIGPEEFSKSVEAANSAFEKNDDAAISKTLDESIRIGISAWMQSMAAPGRALEINAAVRVAQAMAHLGLFTGNPFLLRDADFVLRRAQRSLMAAGRDAEWAQALGAQIFETLQNIWSELVEQSEAEKDPKMLPILSLRERGIRMTHAAEKAFEAPDTEIAYSFAATAIEDLLSLMVFLRGNRPQEIPEEVAVHLSEQGITDGESQRDAIQKARESLLFPALNMALQVRFCCALERHDSYGALEAVAVLTPIAKLIFDEYPGDAGIALNLALAMMDSAGAAVLLADMNKLEEAARRLDEANRILQSLGGQQCNDDVWIRNYSRQIDGALQTIERSRQAAAQSGATQLEPALSALRSKFQNIAARFKETAAKAISSNIQGGA